MPIYEFTCQACNHDFETLVRTSTVPSCPHCQSTRLEKRLSVFATATSTADAQRAMPGPCSTCGHPDGPGSCSLQ